MHGIHESKSKIHSILRAAKRMAQKYGQIGLEEPDDFVQTAMLKLLKRTDEREMPMLWLKKTVHSAAMDAGRRHSREARWICALNDGENNKSVCEIADERGYLATGSNHDDSTMDLEDPEPDLISRLKNVLKELTKPLRQVLILHADGYSDRQIAVMTKTKLGTIRSRLHYARKRARCYLGELG